MDSIPLGTDFAEHIQTELSRCSVFLAVIGRQWMTERLQDENDFVRMEIESALARNIPVIPVLVDGGVLPKKDALPESLRPLLRRNG